MFQPEEDWNDATPQEIPHATYWPIVTALGLTFMFWGILTVYYMSIGGLLMFAAGVGGWISDLRDEINDQQNEESSNGS